MIKRLKSIAVLLFAAAFCSAQQARPLKSSDIFREIKTLKHIPKVLYLAAHPDDENTGLLSWLVNEQNLETAYLSLTRGDGGQNLLGTEQGPALGLIRTHELLAARNLDGAKQFFTRAIDFGFSKNTDDTFKQWNADSITADVVWAIRKFRPDVIICRFPPTAAAGHGQHAASAVVAEKAFKAAADKNQFPNQLKYVSVWQPKRLLWNTFRFGAVNTTAENQLKVTVGQYDPQLGMGYGELAGLSRSFHKSQGAGTQSVAGIRTEYFTQVAGEPSKDGLFGGLVPSWSAKGYQDIDADLNKIIAAFNFNKPDLSVNPLLALRKKIAVVKDLNLRQDKLKAIDQLILSCAGFMGEVVTNQAEVVAGEDYDFRLNLIARAQTPVIISQIKWLNEKESPNRKLSEDSLITLAKRIKIPAGTQPTEPYWMANPPKNAATFSVPNDTLIGLPEAESPLNVVVDLKIGTDIFTVKLPLSFKKLDPVRGDVVEPLRVIPAAELKFTQSVYLGNGEDLTISFFVKRNADKAGKGKISITYNGQSIGGVDVDLTEKNTTVNYMLPKSVWGKINSNRIPIEAKLSFDGATFDKYQVVVQYPHLPTLQYFSHTTAFILKGDVKVKAKKIGYIPGAGDFIPEFLREAGLQVDVLGNADIMDAKKLAGYDAIVAGVRLNNTEKKLGIWMPMLKQYVNDGGTFIMQYNTNQDVTLSDLGFYPFRIANKRVTEEDAAVKILTPNHHLLNYPNKITSEDFKGWVQERGAYFPDQWDQKYEPLFEMHDTGEEPLQGATLYAKYGKGHYIYTPLAFFRQLPAGNVGAARLFFNFLSASKVNEQTP
ncbi:PIG-L family deacetylase [Pedobacter rhizosphaerae]|uniref:N-acetylglucosaminyl deacetylase, LmbE family n=1 Tax=Pedobacter rhizosphaerae TaxID=390241 RepID=A0A1H9NV62_9SPHI|nr:PIG-L family deacetylase [Pedobacter rhizosphaerae]SER39761.1 N-acetylglucosaminyl deacetylase, LmbE family [Pedobacter rhizosphaerae]